MGTILEALLAQVPPQTLPLKGLKVAYLSTQVIHFSYWNWRISATSVRRENHFTAAAAASPGTC